LDNDKNDKMETEKANWYIEVTDIKGKPLRERLQILEESLIRGNSIIRNQRNNDYIQGLLKGFQATKQIIWQWENEMIEKPNDLQLKNQDSYFIQWKKKELAIRREIINKQKIELDKREKEAEIDKIKLNIEELNIKIEESKKQMDWLKQIATEKEDKKEDDFKVG